MSRSTGYAEVIQGAEDRLIPLDVSIELTHRCNFGCRHCMIPDHSVADGLSTNRMLSLLDELQDLGTLGLTLTGGEVLLREDWQEIATRARRLGFWVHLLTNASLVTDEVARTCAELDLAVEVSLYSMNAEIFAEISGGALEPVLRGIERLVAHGVKPVLKVPVMTLNFHSHAEVLRHAERAGLECHAFPRITPAKNGDLAPLALRIGPEQLADFHSASGTDAAASMAESGPSEESRLCGAGTRYANISSSGDVHACFLLPEVAGNVNHSPFTEIWRDSPIFDRIRVMRRRDLKICDGCERLPYCTRCSAMAQLEDGDLLGPSEWACRQAAAIEAAEKRAAEDT